MIEFVSGNFFDFEADIRVNTVNCVGVMGAGAALQFKTRYPKMFEEYLLECRLGRVQIGKPHVWTDQEFFNHSPKIINFPTKDHWRQPSEYSYIEKGLEWLRNYLIHNQAISLTLPALGCGHGGLDWAKVKPMIEQALEGLPTKILVFEPESSTTIGESPELAEELRTKNIQKIQPSDALYPKKLAGKSASEIHAWGNTSLLNMDRLLSVLISNKPSEKEKTAVKDCLEKFIPAFGFTFVMAYNTSFEVDMVKILLEKRAKVVVLIPFGILSLKLRKDIRPLWDVERVLLLSMSKPKQNWSAVENIKNLKFRLKMSHTLLITQEELGFFSKIEKDFLDSNARFFYLNYWAEKPLILEKINARKIGRDKQTLQPKVEQMFEEG
ncbi:hypothetical protein DBR11_14890 [Pedobacter sp. HMWF019]|uniref:macro domain-containing protein n=1 Tax=Pedobacter sp. HMWF019 TaxID=2056856 RepID=UPI000D35AE81|nr:macro domain-containing protein [Pedobacter sp. HMWF019]PTS98417.1 hypothetical protein DBR11_14890 [Pedobacter sp. HMWF019]